MRAEKNRQVKAAAEEDRLQRLAQHKKGLEKCVSQDMLPLCLGVQCS